MVLLHVLMLPVDSSVHINHPAAGLLVLHHPVQDPQTPAVSMVLAPRVAVLRILHPELPNHHHPSPCRETESLSPSAHSLCGAVKVWQV
mgnify:CR=1 FL=1